MAPMASAGTNRNTKQLQAGLREAVSLHEKLELQAEELEAIMLRLQALATEQTSLPVNLRKQFGALAEKHKPEGSMSLRRGELRKLIEKYQKLPH